MLFISKTIWAPLSWRCIRDFIHCLVYVFYFYKKTFFFSSMLLCVKSHQQYQYLSKCKLDQHQYQKVYYKIVLEIELMMYWYCSTLASMGLGVIFTVFLFITKWPSLTLAKKRRQPLHIKIVRRSSIGLCIFFKSLLKRSTN